MRRLVVACFGLALCSGVALAQPAPTQRVVGPIESVHGAVLTVKTAQGEVRVRLSEKAAVFGVVAATLADIKPGDFIGAGAMPMADGSQRAMQVMIFSETQRGTGEGHRPWIHAGSTMTNATVDTSVASVEGRTVTVRYPDGQQRIVVPPEATIRAYVAGERSELKPGAHISIIGAVKRPDGTLEANPVNVGRGDVVPQ
jgi:hypothetical protein